MTSYKVGALSALFSTSDKKVDDLFKASKKPIIRPEPDSAIKASTTSPKVEESSENKSKSKKSKKRKQLEKGNKISEENSVGKKKKKVEDSDDDEDSKVYAQPSRQFQVGNEEKNRLKQKDADEEKRTVFVGNLSTDTTKAQIKNAFKKFGTIEAIRFRGAARPDMKTTKKQAVIQKKFHEKRDNIIAYVRFETEKSAEESLSLNASELGGKTIRVDLSAKSNDTQHDQTKAIFVGNLSFAVNEDEVREHFEKCGKITNVRIIRDAKTGIGKGFCYVNFAKTESVKMALELMEDTVLRGRNLRLSKCVDRPKKTMSLAPKITKGNQAFPLKKEALKAKAKTQTKVVKMNKNQLNRTFMGKAVAEGHAQNRKAGKKGQNKAKNRPSQGERKRKMIAQQLLKK